MSLVEDDPTVLELLAELLQQHGHDPRPVLIQMGDTVASALDRLAAESSPVVLLDLGMPVPGADLLEAARRDPRFAKTRFVIATAGFDAHLPSLPGVRRIAKPYEVPELLSVLTGSG